MNSVLDATVYGTRRISDKLQNILEKAPWIHMCIGSKDFHNWYKIHRQRKGMKKQISTLRRVSIKILFQKSAFLKFMNVLQNFRQSLELHYLFFKTS